MKTKKKFGQNFITDKNLLLKIVTTANIENKNVLEIGPGMGALTQFIIGRAKKYLAYEIDLDLKKELTKFESKTAKIIYQDFLKSAVEEDINTYFKSSEIFLIGNLPYYITSPIIFKFLKLDTLKEALIMVQKEVGQRITAKPNTKAYNGLSVILQYYTYVTLEFNVSRTMFNPVPKVDSTIVRLVKKNTSDPKEFQIWFEKVVKVAFAHKRKTLLNNLGEGFNVQKSILIDVFEQLEIPPNGRAESLTVNDFKSLVMKLKEIKEI